MTPLAWLRTLVITAALCGVVAVALSGCATIAECATRSLGCQ